MAIALDATASLLLACLVLAIGRLARARIGFLARYSIPEPVVGGLAVALLLTSARGLAGLEVEFDGGLQQPLMVAFFATVGLGADLRLLARGGPRLLLFLALVVAVLVLQNAVGLAVARAFDLHPAVGLLAGSITLSGGHGTGAACGELFASWFNLQGGVELAMACATFGLVMGGLLGGPVAERLIDRHGLRPRGEKPAPRAPAESGPAEAASPVDASDLLRALLFVAAALWLGERLAAAIVLPGIVLPGFIWSLLVAILLRNTLAPLGLFRASPAAIELLGSLALSLFLAMALARLRLWELAALALPLLALLAAQAVAAVAFVALVGFRVMGASYDAALLVAGQLGFSLGATPTAIANMQAVAARRGWAAEPFLLVPLTGAFLIDLANALVIQGFLALPVFAP